MLIHDLKTFLRSPFLHFFLFLTSPSHIYYIHIIIFFILCFLSYPYNSLNETKELLNNLKFEPQIISLLYK